jgi:hypothetical protein
MEAHELGMANTASHMACEKQDGARARAMARGMNFCMIPSRLISTCRGTSVLPFTQGSEQNADEP